MVFCRRECTTRREFVKEVAGAAVAGALIGLEATGKEAPKGGERLVAPCGLYCGACPMYIATQENNEQKRKELMQRFSSGQMKMSWEDIQCDGCIAGGRVASFCRKCAMRECAEKKTDVTWCSDCKESPCSRVTSFNNDGMLHHAEVLENLRHMKEVGVKEWAKSEEERWRCPQCRGTITWYDATCSHCGAKRSERLFPLKKA
jgi:hypothetical protein